MTANNLEPRAGPDDCPPFAVSVSNEGPSAWVIDVRGELDIATGPILEHHLTAYNDPSGNNGDPTNLVYLLPRLDFIDARGLHYLLTAAANQRPKTITVREPSRQARRVLELLGLSSMIEETAIR